MLKFLHELLKRKALLIILIVVATGLFIGHSYTVVSRHLNFEVFQVHKVVANESLPMPIVRLLFDSYRHVNSSRPFLQLESFQATFMYKPIPDWALTNINYSTETRLQHYLFFNSVDSSFYDHVMSLPASSWPLRADYVTGDRNDGLSFYLFVNSSNFMETSVDKDKDTIELRIISFDTDPSDLTDTKGVPEYFHLMPCDVVAIAVSLQQYHLINRAESPCRNDYPARVKKLIHVPIKPNWLYNSMLAPDLPYDQRICDDLCVANYWLTKCNCAMSYESWFYSGMSENSSVTLCPEEPEIENADNNCTKKDVYLRTPVKEHALCQCFKSCNGYAFMVSAYDKYRLQPGTYDLNLFLN